MSEVNATNEGADAPKAPETAGEQGNAAAGGASSTEQSQGETSAANASALSGAGETGNAEASKSADASNEKSSEPAATGATAELPNADAIIVHAESAIDAGLPAGEAEQLADVATGAVKVAESVVGDAPVLSLLQQVEAAALRAYQIGATEEHNLMAWLRTHLSGALAAVSGAEELALSPEGQAIVAAIKAIK